MGYNWDISFGSYIYATFFNRVLPPYLEISKGELIFIGYPWVYRIKREWVSEFVVGTTGIFFKPKSRHIDDFRWVHRYKDGERKGYYVIVFANYRAIGAIIEAMQPITGVDIDWDKLKPKWRKYFEEKLYNASVEDYEKMERRAE